MALFLHGAVWTGVCLLAASAHAATPPCKPGDDARVWLSPAQPVLGQALHIMATARGAESLPANAELWVNEQAVTGTQGAAWRSALLAKLSQKPLRVQLRSGARTLACVETKPVARPVTRTAPANHWQTEQTWDADREAHYAAWVERLFVAPPEASLGFRPLAQALWDPERNWLHNHLQLGEDNQASRGALKAAPDCADLPYFLRAYFAWKHALPFAFRECDRGSRDRPPRCPTLHTNDEPTNAKDALGAFKGFVRLLVNKVHSGSLRTALDDENSDFYPVPLTREALSPGSVFADPYGHVLVVAAWIDRPGKPGLLWAVDGQPDASITRKRFWEGNFIFANDVASAGAGFKAFRPLHSKEPRQLTNRELKADAKQPFDLSQTKLSADAFYDQMLRLINPRGLDAVTAYEDTLAALVEQMEARGRSVDNGEQYMQQTKNAVIDMPHGPSIFETTGAWEDYATPSRDLRLLIAMNVLQALPARITHNPKLFALGSKSAADVRLQLQALHDSLTKTQKVAYKNSEGKVVELSVAEVLARKAALQMAYNPNDCAEIRWGAPEGSRERASCRRQAPPEQRQRMEAYRTWFAEARRPPRE